MPPPAVFCFTATPRKNKAYYTSNYRLSAQLPLARIPRLFCKAPKVFWRRERYRQSTAKAYESLHVPQTILVLRGGIRKPPYRKRAAVEAAPYRKARRHKKAAALQKGPLWRRPLIEKRGGIRKPPPYKKGRQTKNYKFDGFRYNAFIIVCYTKENTGFTDKLCARNAPTERRGSTAAHYEHEDYSHWLWKMGFFHCMVSRQHRSRSDRVR